MMNNLKPGSSVIIGDQIRKARKLLGLTPEESAREINVSPEIILEWEEERSRPTLSQLEAMAKLYGREIDFFLRKTPGSPAKIEFRGKLGQSLKNISIESRIVIAKFEELCRNAFEFEELLGKSREIKLLTFKPTNKPETDAGRLRETYNLMDKPVSALRNLLEDSGVRIFELPVPNDEFSGFSFWHSDYGPCILVNARDSEGRRNFTLAHELAHFLYNDGSSLCYIPSEISETYGSIEYRANQFAVELLLPALGITEDFKKGGFSSIPTDKELSKMANKWGVSIQALGYRLENLKLIRKGYTDTLLEPKQKHFRRPKIPAWRRQLGERFVNTSIEAYRKDLISVSKLAHTLGIPIRKAMELVDGRR